MPDIQKRQVKRPQIPKFVNTTTGTSCWFPSKATLHPLPTFRLHMVQVENYKAFPIHAHTTVGEETHQAETYAHMPALHCMTFENDIF